MAARLKETKIETAYQLAVTACNAAYSAQPVRQPDGSTVLLCWSGRIDRAFQRLADALATGQDATKLREGIEVLSNAARKALKESEALAVAWAATAAAVGNTVDPLQCYPPPCTCIGCQNARQRQQAAIARAEATEAIYALLDGYGADEPRLLGYVAGAGEAGQRDLLWASLKRIADALTAYKAACIAIGEQPDWRRLLCP